MSEDEAAANKEFSFCIDKDVSRSSNEFYSADDASTPGKIDEKRSPIFKANGKRSPIFGDSGKRSPIFELNGNRSPIFEDSGKRSPIFEFRGKRSPIFEDNGKRSPIFEDNGNRSPIFEYSGNRSPMFEDIGNRSPIFEDSTYSPGSGVVCNGDDGGQGSANSSKGSEGSKNGTKRSSVEAESSTLKKIRLNNSEESLKTEGNPGDITVTKHSAEDVDLFDESLNLPNTTEYFSELEKSVLEQVSSLVHKELDAEVMSQGGISMEHLQKSNVCPLCLKSFDRIVPHVKSCAAKKKVGTDKLFEAIKLQLKQHQEREAMGLPPLVQQPAPKKKSKAKATVSVPEGYDSNLELAKALSESAAMESQDSYVCNSEANSSSGSSDTTKKTASIFGPASSNVSSCTSKLKGGSSLLFNRSDEDRERIVTEKVAIVLLHSDEQDNLINESAPVIPSSSKMKENLNKAECNGVNMETITTDEDTRSEAAEFNNANQRNELVNGDVGGAEKEVPARLNPIAVRKMNKTSRSYRSNMRKLLQERAMCDLSVVVEDDLEVEVHRLMMRAHCPAILEEAVIRFVDGDVKRFVMWKDVPKEVAIAFFEYIYCEDLDKANTLPEEKLKILQDLTEKYEIPGLKFIMKDMQVGEGERETPVRDLDEATTATNSSGDELNKGVDGQPAPLLNATATPKVDRSKVAKYPLKKRSRISSKQTLPSFPNIRSQSQAVNKSVITSRRESLTINCDSADEIQIIEERKKEAPKIADVITLSDSDNALAPDEDVNKLKKSSKASKSKVVARMRTTGFGKKRIWEGSTDSESGEGPSQSNSPRGKTTTKSSHVTFRPWFEDVVPYFDPNKPSTSRAADQFDKWTAVRNGRKDDVTENLLEGARYEANYDYQDALWKMKLIKDDLLEFSATNSKPLAPKNDAVSPYHWMLDEQGAIKSASQQDSLKDGTNLDNLGFCVARNENNEWRISGGNQGYLREMKRIAEERRKRLLEDVIDSDPMYRANVRETEMMSIAQPKQNSDELKRRRRRCSATVTRGDLEGEEAAMLNVDDDIFKNATTPDTSATMMNTTREFFEKIALPHNEGNPPEENVIGMFDQALADVAPLNLEVFPKKAVGGASKKEHENMDRGLLDPYGLSVFTTSAKQKQQGKGRTVAADSTVPDLVNKELALPPPLSNEVVKNLVVNTIIPLFNKAEIPLEVPPPVNKAEFPLNALFVPLPVNKAEIPLDAPFVPPPVNKAEVPIEAAFVPPPVDEAEIPIEALEVEVAANAEEEDVEVEVDVVDNEPLIEMMNLPANQMNKTLLDPEPIIEPDHTPRPNFNKMKKCELMERLSQYGVKTNMTCVRARKLLTHIYDITHQQVRVPKGGKKMALKKDYDPDDLRREIVKYDHDAYAGQVGGGAEENNNQTRVERENAGIPAAIGVAPEPGPSTPEPGPSTASDGENKVRLTILEKAMIYNEKLSDTYRELLELENEPVIRNPEQFECPTCFDIIEVGGGIVLKECVHSICRTCLSRLVESSDEAEIKCPCCTSVIQEREIKVVVAPEIFDKFLSKSLAVTANSIENAFHCKTPDCRGWCIIENVLNQPVNVFNCPLCGVENCVQCQAIHPSMNCLQYQIHLEVQSEKDPVAKKSLQYLQKLKTNKKAMNCPKCQIIIVKSEGCDWIQCSMCRCEICWATMGPRWGPNGRGDESGGCHCNLNRGKPCTPKCRNCH
ncbi:uncharacterized protein LOC111052537 isoform X2 [Nilaparvata lugens]|nr:uncharacterized protein LOC111052537 isoform X2 [Nilaparvata lugens]